MESLSEKACRLLEAWVDQKVETLENSEPLSLRASELDLLFKLAGDRIKGAPESTQISESGEKFEVLED